MSKNDKNKNKGSKRFSGIKIDMSNVETRAKIEDGQYHVKVDDITQEDGNDFPYLKWVFVIISDDKTNGAKLYTNTSLSPKALWNLKSLIETLGVEVPEKLTGDVLEACIGLECMVRVENEVYEGKDRPKITDYTPLEETTDVEDDGDDKGGDDDEEEEEKDEEEEEETKDDEEEEEEEAAGDDEEEETSDDEEEDEGKVSADEVKEMDEKELADLVKKHGLKVDLKKFPKASKRIGAVIDALEKKGLISD